MGRNLPYHSHLNSVPRGRAGRDLEMLENQSNTWEEVLGQRPRAQRSAKFCCCSQCFCCCFSFSFLFTCPQLKYKTKKLLFLSLYEDDKRRTVLEFVPRPFYVLQFGNTIKPLKVTADTTGYSSLQHNVKSLTIQFLKYSSHINMVYNACPFLCFKPYLLGTV